MAIGTYDVVGKIGSVVGDIPSTLTSGDVAVIVEDAKVYIENVTGQSIDLTNIGSSYQGALVNLGAAHTLARMEGIGADASGYRIGNFSVDKSGETTNQKRIDFFLKQAESQISSLGMPVRFDRTNPSL